MGKDTFEKIKVLELFAGIGACSKALDKLGIEHEIVDAVEIDKYAIKSFNVIHGTNFEPQDITKWDKDISVDLIMHGSPCQDFSVAGLGKGGDKDSGTRSSLMYETLRIVEKLKPKYVVWENVKNILSKKHRHNFDFPEPIQLEKKLKDMLEDKVDEKYYLSEDAVHKMRTSTFNQVKARENKTDICGTLLARDYKDPQCVRVAGPEYRIRKLTPKEYWRLMGFDDVDFEKAEKVNSNTQLYKQAGNSIVVNVLEEILKGLLIDNN